VFMKTLSFGTVLKSMLLAAVLAALLTALFHYVLTEPVIDRAVTLEQLHRQETMPPMSSEEAPLVSRSDQKAGLFLGLLLYGVSLSLVLSVIYHLAQARFSQSGLRK